MLAPPWTRMAAPFVDPRLVRFNATTDPRCTWGMTMDSISVYLADDNLIVREGVRALVSREPDLEVVGTAADYDELIAGAGAAAPQVLVTDIRMPPTFQREGIEAAKELRKQHPGTGIVVLSQYDDPEYAISLLSDGAAGYAYLLKDRIAEGDQLVQAIRTVATGGTTLDPAIVDQLMRPVSADGELSDRATRSCCASSPRAARSRPSRWLARPPPEAVADAIEAPVPAPGPRGVERHGRRAASTAAAAPRHRRPGGAGRDAEPAAAGRRGREARPRGQADR